MEQQVKVLAKQIQMQKEKLHLTLDKLSAMEQLKYLSIKNYIFQVKEEAVVKIVQSSMKNYMNDYQREIVSLYPNLSRLKKNSF